MSVPGFETELDLVRSILFVGLTVVAVTLVPCLAATLRRALPVRPRETRPLEPASFGHSQKARRSPRHAILLHRGLVGALFVALAALFLIPAAAALSAIGVAAIPSAMAFVLPTLLVTLHARHRTARE
ncbi:MAG: hypothetical protein GY910_09400 [bacterium]|nr:hypothetical protein [bacterium]